MRTLAIFLASLLAVPSAAARKAAATKADPQSYQEGYWDREFGTGMNYSVTYQVGLRVGDLDAAFAKVNRALAKDGGVPSGGMSNNWAGDSRRPASRSQQFHIDASKAEKAAKALLDLGELQNYNMVHQAQPDLLKELDERIAALQKEISRGAAALEGLPIAKSLVTRKLERYEQSKFAFEAAFSKAMIYVTLSSGEPSR